MATLYASPSGSGTACSSAQPCSITQAQTSVRAINANMTGDIVVQLADGTYRLSAPLSFAAADSGANGHTVIWRAAPNARPVISGGQRVTGWSQFDAAKNIWRASVGTGFDTRQLYVDGVLSTRARTQVNRSSLTATPTGFTFTDSALSYLNTLANQSRVEVQVLNMWTDRITPVQSISNNTITMQQPAWNNNTWGWDTVQSPFRSGPLYLGNAYEFLDAAGEWYLNTATGHLYYKPLAGQDLSTANVELPRLQSLVHVGGTYNAPAHHLSFVGLQFSHTSWLAPSSNEGFADQQTGGYIKGNWNRPSDAFTSCASGCQLFEATRTAFQQMPAAVQVSASHHVTLSDGRFTNLGQYGLGIGQDANAHSSGVGLGASDITVVGNVFTQLAAGGIVVGGLQPDAHHPSDIRMTNKDIAISNNLIHDIGIDYRDSDAVLATYTTNTTISHNEAYNLPYTGMSIGYGWGINDAGGNPVYVDRGTYNYQPLYSTATTATGNRMVDNYIHDSMQQMADGACIYTLSANPNSVIDRNYCRNTNGWYGFYFDEASRYLSASNNVFNNIGRRWAHANATATNNTRDLTLTNNWTSLASIDITNGSSGNSVTGTVVVTNGNWPSGARSVMNAAGLEPAYQHIKFGPVTAPFAAFAATSASKFGQGGGQFSITGAGADVWGAGGQHDDAYGAIYQPQSFTTGTTVTAKVDRQDNTNPWAKAGVMVRNSMTGAGSSAGYAIVAVTPGNGVTLQWDSNGDGYLDQFSTAAAGTTAPVWVRLTRAGSQVTAYYSPDGNAFTQIGSAVNLSGATSVGDAGVFATSHDANVAGTAMFSNMRITTAPFAGYSSVPAHLGQQPGQLTITAAGADMWAAGNQRDDEYGAIYRAGAASSTTTATVRVDSQDNTNPWAKAGIMLRNNITGGGSALGYAVVAVTPGNNVTLQWDSNSDGYLDGFVTAGSGLTAPRWLRLTRSGTSVTAYHSSNGSTWNTIGTATLTGSAGTQDVGVFATAHSNTAGTATFSQFTIS